MARGRKRQARKGNVASINWGEAELNNFVTRPGTYSFKVVKAELDDEQIIMDAEVTSEGRQEGKIIRNYFNLQPKALWVLARFLEAIGEEIPDDEADMDLDEWIDKEFVATVEEHEWDDKVRLRIQATSYGDIDEADEDDTKKSSKKSRKGKDDDDDDDKKSSKKSRKGKDEEDDEDDKKGRKGKKDDKDSSRGKSRKKKDEDLPKLTQADVEDMDEDELNDLVEKYDLEVDISEARTLRKKAALVLDELEEKDLIEEEKETRKRR